MSTVADQDGEDKVSLSMEIANGRTEIRVSGDRDTAVIVRSASGEQIYMPPEDFDRSSQAADSTYNSPYQSRSGAEASPYQSHPEVSNVNGMEATATGYLIVHPEPITDIRFLR